MDEIYLRAYNSISERKLNIARASKVERQYKRIYSDHFPVIITFRDLPRRKGVKDEKNTVWNLAKIDGWKRYKELTDQYSDVINDAADNQTLSINHRGFFSCSERIAQ